MLLYTFPLRGIANFDCVLKQIYPFQSIDIFHEAC